jgi:hypothetical protein
MNPACYDYWGLRLQANEPWPALAPFQASQPAPAEVRLETRPLPLARSATEVSISAEQVRLHIAGVGRFTIQAGCEIEIVPEPHAPRPALELFLFGSAWGALCYQRGLLPLHSSVVQWGAEAVAFCGPSGSGKSTLVAVLMARGGRLLSDDLCRCDPAAEPAPLVWPSLPRLKLWRETLNVLGRPAADLTQDLPSEDKFLWPLSEPPWPAPLPLRAIYLLRWGTLSVDRLSGLEALRQFVPAAAYRPDMLDRMGRLAPYWRACAQLVRRVPVYQFSRPKDWSSLETAIACLALG